MPKVLVVEDDLRIMSAIRQQLQVEGFTVLEAADAKEAWQILVEEHPDAALVDLYLRTERDGWGLLGNLRQDGRFVRLPVVVMTGSVGPDAGERAAEMDCGFLTKPFESEELMRALREQMKRSRTAVRVSLHLAGLRVEGTVHVASGRFSDGWEATMAEDRDFLSVTDATLFVPADPEREVPFVQVRKADILAVSPLEGD
jgi:two-component system, OmpR family, phosphate regulon response regulator PhoB